MAYGLLGSDYVSLSDYATENNLSMTTLRAKAKSGVYKSAVLCGRVWCAKKSELDAIHKVPENYITIEEYAELYGLKYSGIFQRIQRGVYATPIKINSKWYIYKNENPYSYEGYVTVSEFARMNNVTPNRVHSLIRTGFIEAKSHFENGPILISKDQEYVNYISIKEYAKKHQIPYYLLLNDVHNGVYETARQAKVKWFITADEPCKTIVPENEKRVSPEEIAEEAKNLHEQGYLTVDEYAAEHNQTLRHINLLARYGFLDTVTGLNKIVYVDNKKPFVDYITSREYAARNNVPAFKFREDLRRNVYESIRIVETEKGKKLYFIKADEPCKTSPARKYVRKMPK